VQLLSCNEERIGLKVLVVYYSETKNTEKVAKAIHNEVSKKHEAHLKKADEITADSLNDYDLVFLGSACHSADLAPPIKKLLKAVPRSPKFKLAGFFTHSCPTQERSPESFTAWASKCVVSFEKVSKEKQIDFRGYYNCQGIPSKAIQEFIHNEVIGSANSGLGSTTWEEYVKEALKHPSPEDLCKAEEFARKVISNL